MRLDRMARNDPCHIESAVEHRVHDEDRRLEHRGCLLEIEPHRTLLGRAADSVERLRGAVERVVVANRGASGNARDDHLRPAAEAGDHMRLDAADADDHVRLGNCPVDQDLRATRRAPELHEPPNIVAVVILEVKRLEHRCTHTFPNLVVSHRPVESERRDKRYAVR